MPGPKKKTNSKKKGIRQIVKAAYYPKTTNAGMAKAFGDVGSKREADAVRGVIKNQMKRLKNKKSKAAQKNSKGLK